MKSKFKITPEMEIDKEVGKFLPMQGWHPNYNEFTHDGNKCNIVYVNGYITIFRGDEVFKINLEPLILEVLK